MVRVHIRHQYILHIIPLNKLRFKVIYEIYLKIGFVWDFIIFSYRPLDLNLLKTLDQCKTAIKLS